jgi:hypothetical protein
MRNFTRSIRGELEVLNGVMVTVVHPVASSYGNYALFAYASVDASHLIADVKIFTVYR